MLGYPSIHDCMDAGGRATQDEYRTYSGENVRNIFFQTKPSKKSVREADSFN